MAVGAGVPAPFSDMRELSEDNGERFLWSSFEQQKERDKMIGVILAGAHNVCEKCIKCQATTACHGPGGSGKVASMTIP